VEFRNIQTLIATREKSLKEMTTNDILYMSVAKIPLLSLQDVLPINDQAEC
jgi:hypothetical protein